MGSLRLKPIAPRWTQGGRSVVVALILVNVAAFVGQTLLTASNPRMVEDLFELSLAGIRHGYFWQFLTYMFIHGDPASPLTGVVHLLANMMMLYFAGREVEAITGPKHLLGMYFLGGLIGGIGQVLVPLHGGGVAGSSAGVCAILIAFTTILPEIQVLLLLFFVIPIRLRAKYVGWLVGGSSLLLAVTGVLPGIGHVAHLGGCLVGWAYAKQLGFGRPWRIQRYLIERRQREERLARMPPAQFIQEEIDPLLDKISCEGLRSLTRAERKILELGREKIGGKTSAPASGHEKGR